jgi:Cof subfamily protein (haloacid dehalogenase superfamily)
MYGIGKKRRVGEMKIQLLATDLDGTLMGTSKVIPPRTYQALHKAMDAGCRVSLATGRAFTTASFYARELGINAPLICYQGALILDLRDGSVVYQATLPLEVARRLAAFTQARRLSVQVYLEDHQAYTDHARPVVDTILDKSGRALIEVGDLVAWLDRPPYKFLISERPEAMADLVRELQSEFTGSVHVTQSLDHLVEVTAPEASKGQALAHLAAHLGVAQEATMAMGDHDNDASMIAWAGLGVAVGNASPAAKAVADVIAPPLEEEGAAWAIERYILRA